jgi:hypothetical protein
VSHEVQPGFFILWNWRGKMNVLELISRWTEEERIMHADLIAECLQRELLLNDFKGRIRQSEEELTVSLDHLLSGLSNLAQTVSENTDQIEKIYLSLARAEGNA